MSNAKLFAFSFASEKPNYSKFEKEREGEEEEEAKEKRNNNKHNK